MPVLNSAGYSGLPDMKEAAAYTVVYDISDDRERYRVDKVMRGMGFRVQKSVFECRLSRGDYQSLLRQLNALAISTGSVKIYRVYGGAKHPVIGKDMVDPDGDAIFAF